MEASYERQGFLVGVFNEENAARAAARRARSCGVGEAYIRLGDSLDSLASVAGEMREEVNHVPAAPAPIPRDALRGATLGGIVGAVVGVVISLPFAALPFSLSLGTRLVLVGAVGLVFGSFLGAFIGGALAIKRPDENPAVADGTTLALPDTEATRRAMRDAGALRIDVIGFDGIAIDTIVTSDSGPG